MQHFFTALFLGWLLLLSLSGSVLKAQPILRPQADSLLRVLAASKADTNRVKVLLQLGEYQVYKRGESKADLDSAYSYVKAAQSLSRTLRFERGCEESKRVLIRVLLESNRIDELKAWLQQSKADKTKAALLLELGRHYLYNPEQYDTDLDSAEVYVRQALDLHKRLKDEKGQMESLMALGGVFDEKGDEVQAAASYRLTILLLEKIKDPLQRARAWYQLGYCYPRSAAKMPEKIKAFGQALALYRQLGNKEREALTLKEIADVHLQQGKFAQSLAELIEVLRLQKSIHSSYLHYTYDLLVAVYNKMGNYGAALRYALVSIESAQACGDTVSIEYFRSRLGNLYMQLGEHQKALEVFQGILVRQQQDGNKVGLVLYCTGQVNKQLLHLHRPKEALAFLQQAIRRHPPDTPVEQIDASFYLGETYLHLKSYALAEAHLRKALALLGSNNYFVNRPRYTISINQNLAELYMRTGQYQKARFCLGQAFESTKHRKITKELSETHLQAFKLDSLQGNFSSAIAHYQQYKALNDSLFNEKKSNQLISFQVQYDTEKKEQELQLKQQDLKLKEKNIALLTQQNQAQRANISRRQTERNALLGGALLLLAIMALGYNRYRLKQRSNRLLQAQQQEINHKNEHLSELLGEKDSLLEQKDTLIEEKDHLLTEQQRLLREKERLLKEIHHRVKNNLQVVISLLSLQADSLQDQAALSAIRESQHRVQAISLIHQKLYQNEGVARIPMQDYIQEVVTYLYESHCVNQLVRFRVEVEPIELDVNQAVPLGLIINEALTNAFKHAFPEGRPGTVSLSLLRLEETTYQLTVADDGVGLPAHYNPGQSRSLGMTLLHGFSEQLGGELTLSGPPGLTINLIFQEDQLNLASPRRPTPAS
jgi:two-component sensor histidine kinase